MAKQIPLTNGGFTTVDDSDYLGLSGYRWHRTPKGYARGHEDTPGGWKTQVLMHRLVLGAPEDRDVDHWDRDGLNNQRSNLRLCGASQNLANQGLRRNSRTGFKGVQFRGDRPNPFRARIKIAGADQSLGYYCTAEEAARAYDRAAMEHFGEFARLNFPTAAAA